MKKTIAVGLIAALLLPSGATPALAQHFVRTVAPSAPVSVPAALGGIPGAAPLSRPSLAAPSLVPSLTAALSPVSPSRRLLILPRPPSRPRPRWRRRPPSWRLQFRPLP